MNQVKNMQMGSNFKGYATPEGTRAFFSNRSAVRAISWRQPILLSGSQLTVSKIGIGTYRMTDKAAEHHRALSTALLSGINVIDTAIHFADGGSEKLIGNALRSLITTKKIERDQIVIISRTGLIQGSMAKYRTQNEQKIQSKATPAMAPASNYSLARDFILNSIQTSCERMGIATIDYYLIQSPEVLITNYIRSGMSLDAAMQRAAIDLKQAFATLELARQSQSIRFYGIAFSHDPFAPEKLTPNLISPADRTRPAEEKAPANFWFKCATDAPEGFGMVQFPWNIVESHPQTIDKDLPTELKRIWMLGQHPFLTRDRQSRVFRLLIAPPRPLDTALTDIIDEIRHHENSIVEYYQFSNFNFDSRTPSISMIYDKYIINCVEPEGFEFMLPSIIRAFQKTVSRLQDLTTDEDQRRALKAFVKIINISIKYFYFSVRSKKYDQLTQLRLRLEQSGTLPPGSSLLEYMLAYLLAHPDATQPTTILMGLRQTQYINQLNNVPPLKLLDLEQKAMVQQIVNEFINARFSPISIEPD